LRIGVVLTIATLAGCSTDDGTVTIENTVDACAPLALVSAAPTEIQTAGIDGAQALWRDHGAPSLGLRAGATLEVRFDDAASNFHGLYDDHERVIYINRDLTDQAMLSIVIAHELGHAFGLQHVPRSERISVMNPANLDTPPTAEDQAAVEGLWGVCGG
jgi:hypothetical protein